jgi:hypothetical protein
MCLFIQFVFSWMLPLKLTRFQIFVRICLDNNEQSIHHNTSFVIFNLFMFNEI